MCWLDRYNKSIHQETGAKRLLLDACDIITSKINIDRSISPSLSLHFVNGPGLQTSGDQEGDGNQPRRLADCRACADASSVQLPVLDFFTSITMAE